MVKILNLISSLIFLALLVMLNHWILFEQNLFQVDLLGHLASGVSTFRGLYHEFNDSFFLGNVHGLFYPPLEDFVLALLGFFSNENWEVSFRIYLCITSSLFLWSLGDLIFRIGSPASRLFGALLISILLLMGKAHNGSDQGLSFYDLFVTGLTSQFFGAIFLFRLCWELLSRRRPNWVALWLALCVLSHLVVGLISILLVVFLLIFVIEFRFARIYFFPLLAAAGATSFFWFPFFYFSNELVSSRILSPAPLLLVPPLILLSVFSWSRRELRPFTLLMILLLSSNWISLMAISITSYFPNFQFNRVNIFSLYFAVIVLVSLLSKQKKFSIKSLFLVLIGIAFASILIFQNRLYLWTSSEASASIDSVLERPDAREQMSENVVFGRALTWGHDRPIDFALDKYLNIENREARFAKGLFWESSRSNLAINSFLATLWGRPVILDHYFFKDYPCEIRRCFLDHTIVSMNVVELVWPLHPNAQYLNPSANRCFREILLEGGTSRFSFDLVEQFSFEHQPWGRFRVAPRANKSASNAVIERIQFQDLKTFSSGSPLETQFMRSIGRACKADQLDQMLWLEPEVFNSIEKSSFGAQIVNNDFNAEEIVDIPFSKVESGVYRFNLGENLTLFKVKLAPMPGWSLEVSDDSPHFLWRGFPHLVGLARGEVTLRYIKHNVFNISWLISILSIGIFIFIFIGALRRKM